MRFSLFGVPVVVRPMFWIVAVMLGMPHGTSKNELLELASWILLLLGSILVHEFGHAFAMRAFGRNPSIELWGLGGLTHWGPGPEVSAGRHIVVSLAGPAAGFALGIVVLIFAATLKLTPGSFAAGVVRQALWINIGWGIVNLFPILPLDGGHALEWTATWILGERGRRGARMLSLALAAGAAALAIWQKFYWLAFLAFWCASISYRALSAPAASAATQSNSRDPRVDAAVREAWLALMSGNANDATRICQALLAALPEGAPERDEALELMAWARIEAGDEAGAIQLSHGLRRPPSELLAARLLIASGKMAEGLQQLERAYYAGRDSFAALVLSAVYVDQERPDLALEMLLSERGKRLSSATHLVISAQLFYAERYELSLRASELGWQRFHEARHAYNAACSLAKLGRIEHGLEYLESAVRAGFDEPAALDQDADLAPLRAHPRFAEIRAMARPAGNEAR